MTKKTETAPEKATAPAENEAEKQAQAAEAATAAAAQDGKLPETMAVTNPAPATEVEASGAVVEQEIKDAIPLDHPAVDDNPRAGTSAIQNGGDYNDPRPLHPSDPEFAGQGLDMSVYGKIEKPSAE